MLIGENHSGDCLKLKPVFRPALFAYSGTKDKVLVKPILDLVEILSRFVAAKTEVSRSGLYAVRRIVSA